MKRTLIFFEILCMIFFLLFSSTDKRTQFLISLAGPGMLSLVNRHLQKLQLLRIFQLTPLPGFPLKNLPESH